MSGEYDDAIYPGGIPQLSTAQEHLIWTEGDLTGDACVGEELQSSFVCVQ